MIAKKVFKARTLRERQEKTDYWSGLKPKYEKLEFIFAELSSSSAAWYSTIQFSLKNKLDVKFNYGSANCDCGALFIIIRS